MSFTAFDTITASIIIISTLLGLYKGFVDIMINLFGFVMSIILAVLVYPYIRNFLEPHISGELFLPLASGTGSYILSLIVMTLITSKLSSFCKLYTGGFIDRILGLAAGFLRGGIFVIGLFAIIVILVSGTYSGSNNAKEVFSKLDQDKYPEWLKNSSLTGYYHSVMLGIIDKLPEESLTNIKIPHSKPLSGEDVDHIDANNDPSDSDNSADNIETENSNTNEINIDDSDPDDE